MRVRSRGNTSVQPETIAALGDSFVEDVSRYIVPIFTDVKGRPVSTGTGFFLDTGFEQAMVTAAHVLDDIRRGRDYYFYASPNTKRAIAGTVLSSKLPPTGRREDDLVDVVVVLLEGEEDELPPFSNIGKISLPLNLLLPQAPRLSEFRYAFLGFPSSKGKANPIAKSVRSAAYSYLSASVPSGVYTQLQLEEASHIVLPFKERNIYNLEAQRIQFPSPIGMSGSPLWLLRGANSDRRVVGVTIEYRKTQHVVIAADIWFVLRILRDYFRDIGRLIVE